MNINLIKEKKIWEDFLDKEKPSTFLQSWNWGEVNHKRGEKIWRLGTYENNELQATCLVIKVKAKRGTFLFVPHGPTFKANSNRKDILKTLTKYLISLGKEENCVFFRISSLLRDTSENNSLFIKLGYREAPIHMMHPELGWLLNIEKDEKTLLKEMRKNTRYYIRKAEKDLVMIEKSSDLKSIDQFWRIYEQTAKRHSFVPFSKQYIQTEAEIFLKDNETAFFFVKYKGEIIAAALIIFYNHSAFYHQGASIRNYPKLATTSYLLQWHAIQEAKKRGLKLYNFWGISTVKRKNHPWKGVTLFKTGFGGFSEKYVHAKDYVLSSRYLLTYLVELVRKLKRGYRGY